MSIRKSSCWLSRFSCIRESMALAGLGVQDELQPPRRRAGAASAGASSWRSAARLPRTQIVIGMENRSFADTRNRSQMSPFERRRQAIANTIQQTCGLSSAERLPKRFCMAAEDMGPRGTLAFPWDPCPLQPCRIFSEGAQRSSDHMFAESYWRLLVYVSRMDSSESGFSCLQMNGSPFQ